jgi:cbb3-type cytochrome oxidase subunit 1
MTALNFITKTIFWLTIIFIAIIIFSFTVGQAISIEFKDYEIKNNYYDFAFSALPVAIGLTLFGTIKKRNKKSKNWQ